MLWFSLSFLTAALSATEAAYLKRTFRGLNPFEAALLPSVFSIPLFAVLLLFLDSPVLDPNYWPTFALLLPINITGSLFYFRGINLSPLSLTLPYLAFTPAFALGTGYLILGEVPNLWGSSGVLLIVLGSYILNLESKHSGGWLAPFKVITAEPGTRAMLGAAFVFAFSAVLGKKGIIESDPLFFACTFFIAQGLTMLIVLPLMGKARLSALKVAPGRGLTMGLLVFVHILCHCLAMSLVKAAYMIAVKRLNAVFGVLLGGLWLGESGMNAKLAGASLMFAGAAVIGLLGQ
ncbi:MAG: DMT family transporter [Proteobacteria bacterium]|nr:DMT family transporter [Pseudomonadota bacterium]